MDWMRMMTRRVAELVAVALASFMLGVFALAAVAAWHPEAVVQTGLKLAAFHATYDFAAVAQAPILQQAKGEKAKRP